MTMEYTDGMTENGTPRIKPKTNKKENDLWTFLDVQLKKLEKAS